MQYGNQLIGFKSAVVTWQLGTTQANILAMQLLNNRWEFAEV